MTNKQESVEVLPGFVGPFEATRLNEGVWRVRDDAGEILVDDVGQATATTLAAILNSHGAVVGACQRVRDRVALAAAATPSDTAETFVARDGSTTIENEILRDVFAALSLPQ